MEARTSESIDILKPGALDAHLRLWNWKSGLSILLLFLLVYLGTSIALGFASRPGEQDIPAPASSLVINVALGANIVASAGSVLLIGMGLRRYSLGQMGLRRTKAMWLWIAVALAVGLVVARVMLLSVLWLIFPALGAGLETLEQLSLKGTAPSHALVTLLMMSVLVPLGEELFWRGFVHNWMRSRINPWLAIGLSSLAFGLFHLIPLQVIGAVLLGLALAWIYEASGSLWPAILLHVINNLIGALFTLF